MQTLASRPSREDAENLFHSQDPLPVKRAAVAFARSPAADDHHTLSHFLADGATLQRLDTAADYQQTYRDLRLSSVIQALMENPAPSAHQLILRLLDVELFLDDVLRRQLLIQALAVVRPSPPQAIAYWDQQSQPHSPVAYDVIQALCINQSPPAMELLAHKLADTRFDLLDRADWIHLLILPRRNDVAILQYGERLLSEPGELPLQMAVLETLFDYRPDEWYIGDRPPVPPSIVAASSPAKEALYRIGRQALDTLEPPLQLRQAIEATLAKLGS